MEEHYLRFLENYKLEHNYPVVALEKEQWYNRNKTSNLKTVNLKSRLQTGCAFDSDEAVFKDFRILPFAVHILYDPFHNTRYYPHALFGLAWTADSLALLKEMMNVANYEDLKDCILRYVKEIIQPIEIQFLQVGVREDLQAPLMNGGPHPVYAHCVIRRVFKKEKMITAAQYKELIELLLYTTATFWWYSPSEICICRDSSSPLMELVEECFANTMMYNQVSYVLIDGTKATTFDLMKLLVDQNKGRVLGKYVPLIIAAIYYSLRYAYKTYVYPPSIVEFLKTFHKISVHVDSVVPGVLIPEATALVNLPTSKFLVCVCGIVGCGKSEIMKKCAKQLPKSVFLPEETCESYVLRPQENGVALKEPLTMEATLLLSTLKFQYQKIIDVYFDHDIFLVEGGFRPFMEHMLRFACPNNAVYFALACALQPILAVPYLHNKMFILVLSPLWEVTGKVHQTLMYLRGRTEDVDDDGDLIIPPDSLQLLEAAFKNIYLSQMVMIQENTLKKDSLLCCMFIALHCEALIPYHFEKGRMTVRMTNFNLANTMKALNGRLPCVFCFKMTNEAFYPIARKFFGQYDCMVLKDAAQILYIKKG